MATMAPHDSVVQRTYDHHILAFMLNPLAYIGTVILVVPNNNPSFDEQASSHCQKLKPTGMVQTSAISGVFPLVKALPLYAPDITVVLLTPIPALMCPVGDLPDITELTMTTSSGRPKTADILLVVELLSGLVTPLPAVQFAVAS